MALEYFIMDQEEANRWLSFRKKGLEATRYKSRAIVYSNKSISKRVEFNLAGYEVRFIPINEVGFSLKVDYSQKYIPAFICEVVADASVHRGGGNFDIPAVLDEVLTWLEFDYTVNLSYEAWEEYKGEWVKSPNVAALSLGQECYVDLPKQHLQTILELYEKAKNSNSKRAKKVITIRKYLQDGLRLREISKTYSFLSFYKVVELVSDDLSSKQYCSTGHEVAQELVKFKLLERGSQRTKIYYLLKAVDNKMPMPMPMPIAEMLNLADVRNELAHSDKEVNHESLDLCQILAFWAGERFVEIAALGD